ncbi:MAG: class I SAM-dependent rRNA methyltransferase [Gemmatimonadota bacterium]|nr:class I SAM-dependent rRNA methyltransferase [Gemmatimonadota bacterium]MDQ8167698.1 class I SAM-dependent rRNA methyltransferase [Gemmatimonadota bacterium]MDQ8172659.1 class I SAM-dependent rRNA methyltransferase [Gemmatimonadota bacterium]
MSRSPRTEGAAVVSRRAVQRLRRGHPWIFRSDVERRPTAAAGIVPVEGPDGAPHGFALWSPLSEISLRRIETDPARLPDAGWWHDKLRTAIARRAPLSAQANAYRLVHGEGDGLPSLVVDRYGDTLVVQLLSAGVDAWTEQIVSALIELTGCTGILARNDPAARGREGLPREVRLLHGDVPRTVEVEEHGVRYFAAPWDGQKTGAFLDQRENRVLIGSLARGQALDCFAYHGSFALHLAKQADRVVALDVSAPALARVHDHAERNGFSNIEPVEGDAFDVLRTWYREGRRFDTIVVDPPAFAKTKNALDGALRGYKDINLQAMRLLAPGGLLFTASCSFHLSRGHFFEMLQDASADSGRAFALRAITGQPLDHPELITVPETGYLKGALLEAMN